MRMKEKLKIYGVLFGFFAVGVVLGVCDEIISSPLQVISGIIAGILMVLAAFYIDNLI